MADKVGIPASVMDPIQSYQPWCGVVAVALGHLFVVGAPKKGGDKK
jgi:hypothetical protein